MPDTALNFAGIGDTFLRGFETDPVDTTVSGIHVHQMVPTDISKHRTSTLSTANDQEQPHDVKSKSSIDHDSDRDRDTQVPSALGLRRSFKDLGSADIAFFSLPDIRNRNETHFFGGSATSNLSKTSNQAIIPRATVGLSRKVASQSTSTSLSHMMPPIYDNLEYQREEAGGSLGGERWSESSPDALQLAGSSFFEPLRNGWGLILL
ncbi:hypothetical protein PQX77_006848 [Marasmius sp. AFHP31]|nr:hypothetical protein PQX77_006848 [Marasmius sp. AFHP31]